MIYYKTNIRFQASTLAVLQEISESILMMQFEIRYSYFIDNLILVYILIYEKKNSTTKKFYFNSIDYKYLKFNFLVN